MDAQLKSLEERFAAQTPKSDERFEELLRLMQQLKEKEGGARQLGYVPKLEFPEFDGSHTHIWLKKCIKYFTLCKISDDPRVDLAALNMIDRAELWVTRYLANRVHDDWNDFVIDVNARFRDEFETNVVQEFNGLQQTDSIESYIHIHKRITTICFVQFQTFSTLRAYYFQARF